MSSRIVLLGTFLILASIDSTLQNEPWYPDPAGQRAIMEIMAPVLRKRTNSPCYSSDAGVGTPLSLHPVGDRLLGSMLSSPVTDSCVSQESDTQRSSSGSGNSAKNLFISEDWQLPPAFGAIEDEGSLPVIEPVPEESVVSSEEGAVRRLCHLCKLMDATRGVAERSDSGRWVTLVCRHCSQFIKSTIALSTRCHSCRRYANFGPVGGSRREARHCKSHRQPYEVNVARKHCSVASCKTPLTHFSNSPHSDQSQDMQMILFRGSNYREWHTQERAGLRGGGMEANGVDVSGRGHALGGRAGVGGGGSTNILPQAGLPKRRQCMREGCVLTASFGSCHTGAILCSAHRRSHHVDLIHKKRCEFATCDRNPAYGLSSEGLARFCKTHRPGNYIDLRGRKCQHPYGCGIRPSFGDVVDSVARFCMKHKLGHHVNVKSKKCQEHGCPKQPTFGGRHDMLVRFCAVHRRPDDVDLVHAHCRKNGCVKLALFGFMGEAPQMCTKHREAGMINNNSVKISAESPSTSARPDPQRGAEGTAGWPVAKQAVRDERASTPLRGWSEESVESTAANPHTTTASKTPADGAVTVGVSNVAHEVGCHALKGGRGGRSHPPTLPPTYIRAPPIPAAVYVASTAGALCSTRQTSDERQRQRPPLLPSLTRSERERERCKTTRQGVGFRV